MLHICSTQQRSGTPKTRFHLDLSCSCRSNAQALECLCKEKHETRDRARTAAIQKGLYLRTSAFALQNLKRLRRFPILLITSYLGVDRRNRMTLPEHSLGPLAAPPRDLVKVPRGEVLSLPTLPRGCGCTQTFTSQSSPFLS